MMPEEKEPWQMTRDEWLAFSEAETKRAGFEWTADSVKRMTRQHELQVRSAIVAELPVPTEVLEGYPNLAEAIPEAEEEQAIDIRQGVIKRGKELVANPDNIPAARGFVAELRRLANEAEAKALATTESKARLLNQNARQARRDADRIERTIKVVPGIEVEVAGAVMSRWLTPTEFANLVISAVESGMDLEEAIRTIREEAEEAGVPEEVIDEGIGIAEGHFEGEEEE